MTTIQDGTHLIRGCSFLVEDHPLERIFVPEEFDEEQRMIGNLALEFVEGSVLPKLEAMEAQEPGVMLGLLKEAGELGLLGIDVPESYGGFAQSKAVSMLVAENLARSGSFQVAHGAHSGTGTLPIVYFGTPEQKDRYLRKLASGEWIGAYALTEAGSGSDALAAKTRATLDDKGENYVLNGEKMFITNAGLADVFIVFAQIDGDKFTAFIVERATDGISTGAEEKKMGIKGSSTRTLILQDALVPVGNVLGEVGRGHVIAFNILNVGRFKLGAGAVGGAREAIEVAARYARERKQFGRPIFEFGMIKHKIGEAASRIFAARSMVYRTAGYIDQNIASLDKESATYDGDVIRIGIREYATECSMMKVFCSEVLDYCVDETVQIHGGYGFVSEYPAERYYRDSRINRIYEGTNEINRLVIMSEVLRKALRNELPIFARAKALLDELMGMPSLDDLGDTAFLAPEKKLVGQAKKAVLLALGTAAQQKGEALRDEQEVLGALADMIMDVYAMESCVLRSLKLRELEDRDAADLAAKKTRLFCNEAMTRLEVRARDVLAAVTEGDMLATTLSGLRRVMRRKPIDAVTLRREIAETV